MPDLPLSDLLRLSLFQISVGIVLVLPIGPFNRVSIVELNVPASLVGFMISLPLLFAPFRALIGFRRQPPFRARMAAGVLHVISSSHFATVTILSGSGVSKPRFPLPDTEKCRKSPEN
jgi:hypothetical protein